MFFIKVLIVKIHLELWIYREHINHFNTYDIMANLSSRYPAPVFRGNWVGWTLRLYYRATEWVELQSHVPLMQQVKNERSSKHQTYTYILQPLAASVDVFV